MPNTCLIKFVCVSVNANGYQILDNVNGKVPENSWTCIIGPNGAGKTTLLLALMGEIKYTGNIQLRSKPDNRKLKIGYVPQKFQLDRTIPLTVSEFLALGLQRRPLWLGIREKAKKRAKELLGLVGAGHLFPRSMGALSGGELQRVLLALSLSQEPDILILDEPSSGIDPHGDMLLCEILEQLKSQLQFTVLMVTHDLTVVRHHADHVICLKRRVIAEGHPSFVLTKEILSELFGLHVSLPICAYGYNSNI